MKKRWLMISLLLGGLMVAITGGLVMAQAPDTKINQTKQSKAGRLAEILSGNVTEESVQDAFTQIAREKQDAAVEKRLAWLVSNSKMTQADADAYIVWFKLRPDNIKQGLPIPGFENKKSIEQRRSAHSRFRGFKGHQGFRGQEVVPSDSGVPAN